MQSDETIEDLVDRTLNKAMVKHDIVDDDVKDILLIKKK